MNKKERALEIYSRLAKRYPAPEPALDWTNAWELLVATVLAAQCTDERVNKVTPALFKRWPSISDMAAADIAELEEAVRSTGFFRNKAKNLKNAAARIMDVFDGTVPSTMSDLISLPGVARKTANIVLSNAYGIHEGIAVDTHVKRLTYRMGLTKNTDPVRIEKDLMPLYPRETWGDVNHFLVYYGREVCNARSPRCGECELADICPKHGVD
ncbi:endonuclease III [Pseudodesulfovibrio senegalensis]|uniref:Endonuclease III n=1 Tax=Pseudodesulfovibrio senegalensis TaxID=1721087 RepID=A0A6N6N6K0_9BACT|nr:endonuclease III [Pseudodesulfovibrio senegalensis]KAB1443694.1 endonuclease III [Pseudodesulfovibrio senegalensis]